MRYKALCVGLTMLFLVITLSTTTEAATFNLILQNETLDNLGDAAVREDTPDTNYPSETALRVITSANAARRAYVMFNLSQIPTDSSIEIGDVYLTLNQTTTNGVGTWNLELYHVYSNVSWSESTVTWNNQPCGGAAFDNSSNCNLTVIDNTVGWLAETDVLKTYNVTEPVQKEFALGSTNFSFLIKMPSEDGVGQERGFSSRDDDPATSRPLLNVTYDDTAIPRWSNEATSGTVAASSVTFSTLWTSITNMSGSYTFSWHNGTNWTRSDLSTDQEAGIHEHPALEEVLRHVSTVFFDQFNETTDTEFSAHTPSEAGTAWIRETGVTATYVWRADGANDYAERTGGDNNDYDIWYVNDSTTTDSYNVSVTLTVDDTLDDVALLFARYHNDTDNYFVKMSGTATEVGLWRVVDDVATELDTTATPTNNGDVVRFEVTDSNKTVYLNEAKWLTTADNSVDGIGVAALGCGDYKGDGAEDCTTSWKVDDFTVSEWIDATQNDTESNKTPDEYSASELTSAYDNLDNITITVEIDLYNNSGSTAKANNAADLLLEAKNSSEWVRIGEFDISGTGNDTQVITEETVLSHWETPANRDYRISAVELDWDSSSDYDNITWDGVWATIESQQFWKNDTSTRFVRSDCAANWTECWSNVTYGVNDTVGANISWRYYTNNNATNTNRTDQFSFLTTAEAADSCDNCDGTANCQIDCTDQCSLTSDIDMNQYNITFTGNGRVSLTANITDYDNIRVRNSCVLRIRSGGGLWK